MIEYLTRECELEKHRKLCAVRGETPCENGWLDQIHWLAAGDEDLFAFAWAAANFSHAWDDLVDEGDWDLEMIEAAQAALCHAVVSTLRTGLNGVSDVAFERVWLGLMNASQWGTEQVFFAVKARNDFFFELGSNEFVRRHAAAIETLLVMCMTRMLDGDAFARSEDPARRALAPAVSCGDVDFYAGLVYLARGWAALRGVSKWRDYDQRDAGPSEGDAVSKRITAYLSADALSRPEMCVKHLLLDARAVIDGKTLTTQEAK